LGKEVGPKDEIGDLLGVQRDLLSIVPDKVQALSIVPDKVQALSEASQEVPGKWDNISCVVQSSYEGMEFPEGDSSCLDGVTEARSPSHELVEWEGDEEQPGVHFPAQYNL
jgi:hypothetical protein